MKVAALSFSLNTAHQARLFSASFFDSDKPLPCYFTLKSVWFSIHPVSLTNASLSPFLDITFFGRHIGSVLLVADLSFLCPIFFLPSVCLLPLVSLRQPPHLVLGPVVFALCPALPQLPPLPLTFRIFSLSLSFHLPPAPVYLRCSSLPPRPLAVPFGLPVPSPLLAAGRSCSCLVSPLCSLFVF